MPHKCTNCDRVFEDGSKEMLSGCPNCGGNTFQYLPEPEQPTPEESPPDRPGPDSRVARTVGRAATTLRDAVSSGSGSTDARPPPETEPPADDQHPDADVPSEPPQREAETDAMAPEAETDAPAREAGTDSEQRDSTTTASREAEADEPTADTARDDGPSDEVADAEAPSGATRATGPAGEDVTGPKEGVTGREDEDRPAVDDAPENFAQSSARSDVVSSEELPDGVAGFGSPPTDETDADGAIASGPDSERQKNRSPGPGPENPPTDGTVVSTPSEETPNLTDLRAELNDQFEGIRIVERGQYELNLMELYEREETIIALKENGRYVIEPPESWRGDG